MKTAYSAPLVAIGATYLAACGNDDQLSNKIATPVASSPLKELFLTPMQSEGIQYIASYDTAKKDSDKALALVKTAMESYLFDPVTAQYSYVKRGRGGAVCGRFNAKNRYGAYIGFRDFVLTSDGRIVSSNTVGGISASSDSSYIQAYLDACATKTEIAAFRPTLDTPSSEEHVPDERNQEPDSILDAPLNKAPPTGSSTPTA